MNPYIELSRVPIVIGRQDFVLARCNGKRALHLGCADSGLFRERFLSGELMHQRLAGVTAELWGIDTDVDGISFLRSQGFDNLIVGDVCNLNNIPEFQGQRFDVIVASEIIEHLMNPGLFLEAVKNLMIPGHTELIVTVPNAFRVSTLLWLPRGVEYVHPDHNYWFSYHTVTNLLRKSGLAIHEVYAYSFQSTKILPRRIGKFFGRRNATIDLASGVGAGSPPTSIWIRAVGYCKSIPRRLLVRLLYKRTPFWGDGIIVVCRRP